MRCGMMPTDTMKSGENTMEAITAPPSANEMGTPSIRRSAIEPNRISAVIRYASSAGILPLARSTSILTVIDACTSVMMPKLMTSAM